MESDFVNGDFALDVLLDGGCGKLRDSGDEVVDGEGVFLVFDASFERVFFPVFDVVFADEGLEEVGFL